MCAAPRREGTILAVDSTFATPICQLPLDLGADIVMHSATKFLGGHSDLLAGALIVHNDDLLEELHQRRLLNGGVIGSLEAFLTLRGMRTLHLRMERALENAEQLAHRLKTHPNVAKVRYPGLQDDPNNAIASTFMNGYGACLLYTSPSPRD